MFSLGQTPRSQGPLRLTLVLLDVLPKPLVMLNTHFLARVELVETPEVHRLVKQRDDVLVEPSQQS